MLFSGSNMWKAAFDALNRSQAIIEFTPEGTILTANPNFLKAMGYALNEVQGKPHSMFVDPAYAASAEYKAFWKKLAQGEFQTAEYLREETRDVIGPFEHEKFVTEIETLRDELPDYFESGTA